MGGERSAGRRRGHPRSAAKCRETCAAFAEQNRTDQEHRQSSGEWAGWVAGPGEGWEVPLQLRRTVEQGRLAVVFGMVAEAGSQPGMMSGG